MSVLAPISWGELIDKYTILMIKSARILDPAKLVSVQQELTVLEPLRDRAIKAQAAAAGLEGRLKEINESLWDLEDRIRECERAKDFGPGFIELARAVYHTNDRRMGVKREINVLLGSDLTEEKSYSPY